MNKYHPWQIERANLSYKPGNYYQVTIITYLCTDHNERNEKNTQKRDEMDLNTRKIFHHCAETDNNQNETKH